jgi:hypothetical protein
MKLTTEERQMLDGGRGAGVAKAMEIIVALGRLYGAERLVPVGSVQVAGVSYRNLGAAGLEFLREWADQGARARVPATLNPAGIDLEAWRALGFSKAFAQRQDLVVRAYERLGVRPTCTCTPYLIGNQPRLGEHVAWAESSAVSYANSVLGARTNREGGPSALAAAITGRTAAYGLHLEEARRASLKVEVRCPVSSFSDFGALGYLVGKVAQNRVPFFEGLNPRTDEDLKALGAAMAASGAVALYHVADVTPEADRPQILKSDHETFVVSDLAPGFAALTAEARDIDLVWFGCPHASLDEIRRVVELLDGRRSRAALWVTTAREIRERAAQEGLVDALEASGGRLVADMCVVVAPMQELDYRTMATPSAKGAVYVPSHAGLVVRYGSIEQCVEAAVSGVWAG